MGRKKYFTPRDIDPLIPELEEVFEHIKTCRARAQALSSEIGPSKAEAGAAEVARLQLLRSQVQFLLEAVRDDVSHILALGGVTKDLEAGLVDFPGRLNGQEVWLCWRRGEPAVGYWHALDQGFGGRQALPRPDPRTTFH